MKRMTTKLLRRASALLAVLLIGPLLTALAGDVDFSSNWQTASREVVGIAPDPSATPEAVVQVYAARAFNWRGLFAVHTWIAVKGRGAEQFTVYHVLGWRAWRGQPVVVASVDRPDRRWYGSEPRIIADLRGARAERAIAAIEDAVAAYPHAHVYRLWPGPNSNTFTAFVGRAVPELGMTLPVTAIGKDYLPDGAVLGRAPSGTGYQISLLGAFGLTVALREGLEINLLGLGLGLDVLRPALKLPGIGRIGMKPRVG